MTESSKPPTPFDEPARERGGPGRAGRVAGIAVLVFLLGFGGGVAGYVVADSRDDGSSGSSSNASSTSQVLRDGTSRVSDSKSDETFSPREIYAAASPAVAHISTRVTREGQSFFGLQTEPEEAEGTGSGFVISDKGYIVTNAHVIEDATEVTATFGKDGTPIRADVIGTDPSSDIAVLKVDPESKEIEGGLRTVEFGDSSKLEVGDPVLAIGNPFSLDRTLTTGVVSALQREIPALNDFAIDDVIQTDAAVNPGNSGGPLLNAAGEVIGVNSQIQSRGGGFDGIAFAVPSATVKGVVDQLIDKGTVEYAWLGVSGGELTQEIADELDLKVDEGVVIGQVTPGSPAARAGLRGATSETTIAGRTAPKGSDVILQFDGKDVATMREVAAIVDGKRPGDEVKLRILRDGKEREVTVTLGNRPTESSSSNE